jgi:GT2 family glycosyltransferase
LGDNGKKLDKNIQGTLYIMLENHIDRKVLVTIAIITNGKRIKELDECLESISNQKFKEFEIVIVADNVDQEFLVLVRKWNMRLPVSVRLIYNPYEVGIGNARNQCLEVADGEIIAFIDDDAIASRNWIASMVNYFRTHNVQCITGPVYPKLAKRFAYNIFMLKFLNNNLRSRKLSLIGCNMAFRTYEVRKVGGFSTQLKYGFEEIDISYRLIKQGYKIDFCTLMKVYHDYARTCSDAIYKSYKEGPSLLLESDKGSKFESYLSKLQTFVKAATETRSATLLILLFTTFLARRIGKIVRMVELMLGSY